MFAASKTASVSGGYQIQRSLRFNESDSAYLNRTPASAGSLTTWTWSGWIKRSILGSSVYSTILGALSGSNNFEMRFNADTLDIYDSVSGVTWRLTTTQVFRDPSAWYHIVFNYNSTQATSSNRLALYVNGVQVTAFLTATYPSQNNSSIFNSAIPQAIGSSLTGTYMGGYMTEVNFIDGQALTPSSFGETNAQTGVWQPKAYSGSYGTNGFYLNFSDNSNTTAATLGKDYSGNGNNWTPNNFSVTAGAGNDSLVDSPTSYGVDTGAGGTVRGNYATLNALSNSYSLANGNLDVSSNVANNYVPATIVLPTTGKYYFEYTCTNAAGANRRDAISVVDTGYSKANVSATSNSVMYLSFNGGVYSGPSATLVTTYSSWDNGDTVSCAIDCDTGKIWFAKNGVFNGSPSAGTSPATTLTNNGRLAFAVSSDASLTTYSLSGSVNFGQRPFAYTAPSGFKALCTQNLPTPTIGATTATQASQFFAPVIYTGTGASRSVTVGFQPDLVWAKIRDTSGSHGWFDSVRGATKRLVSDTTAAEDTISGVTSFNSDGFSVLTAYNASGFAYASWNWKANGSGSTNTAGSITSTVSANTTSGFSVVTYTGTGATATVGHGLGVAPAMIICKARGATTDWAVYTQTLGINYLLQLNTTSAAISVTNKWSGTNSSVFGVNFATDVNGSSVTHVAYCFAEVAGYSKFGSYTGNGSADGPFVFTGFRPAYVMFKRTDVSGENWQIRDAVRDTYNVVNKNLRANLSDAETTFDTMDMVSNGFKLRSNDSGINGSGGTYIYMAFATSPFKYSLAR